MNNINEETPRDFLTDLNTRTQRSNPEIQAQARLNVSKNKLREKGGGDFWEGGSKKEFFNIIRQAIERHFKNDIHQLKYYQRMLNKYEQITPEKEFIKSDAQTAIDKENSKNVKVFDSKKGMFKEESFFNY